MSTEARSLTRSHRINTNVIPARLLVIPAKAGIQSIEGAYKHKRRCHLTLKIAVSLFVR